MTREIIQAAILGAFIGVWAAGMFTGAAQWRLLTEARTEAKP